MKAMDRLMRGQETGAEVGESQLGPESPVPPQLAFLKKPGISQGFPEEAQTRRPQADPSFGGVALTWTAGR